MKKALLLLMAGVALGILLAPEKGSTTWKKIVDGLDEFREKAMDEINSLVDSGKDFVGKEKNRAGV